jgi:predicted small integral membrane protein
MLRISLSDINKSIKFSAFIASGVLFVISLVQIMITDTLFWELVAGFSGVIFILLLISVLWKILKPSFKSWKKKREKKTTKGDKSFFEKIKSLFEKNTYLKIMAIIWFIIILVGLEIAVRFIGLLETDQSRFRVLANFGFMIITVSTALFILNINRLFVKKKKS